MNLVSARTQTLVLDRIADLDAFVDQWRALAYEAIEPNVFYEPCVLLPALRAFAHSTDLAIVLVMSKPTPAAPQPELWGLFPLERCAPSLACPVSSFRFWTGDYSYVPTPLIHRGHAATALSALFDWLQTQRRAAPLLSVDGLPLGGPFHGLLVDELCQRRAHLAVRDSFTRALFAPECDAQTYLARALPSKDRREIQRQRKRLCELGAQLVRLCPDDHPETWADEFLALEASGWKGRDGSAMACKPRDAAFFREMFSSAVAAGRLSSTALRIDGRPIAMQILLHAGAGAYGFKTCYDETYSRLAPGLHLEIDLIEKERRTAPWRWIDSAAAHYHPLFNRIYTEQRCIERWWITTERALGLMITMLPVLRWAKRSFFPRSESAPVGKRGRRSLL